MASKRKATTRKKPSRKRNSHDPDRSTKRFEAAVRAADRELADASVALDKGRWDQSIQHLNRASYFSGVARTERDYARFVEAFPDDRLKILEAGMKNWGKNFMDAQRKSAA